VAGAVGDLEHHQARKVRALVGLGLEGVDEGDQLLRRGERRGDDGGRAVADGGEDAAEDLEVEGELVVEVVVDHRLVEAGAAGDGVDGGAAEAVEGELGDGGGEDGLAGIKRALHSGTH